MIPSTMRALVLYDVDDIRIETRSVPEVRDCDMLVKAMASGICSGDVMAWYVRRKAPLVLGHEPAGIVVKAGAEARDGEGRRFDVGQRVFVHHHAPCFACKACERGDYVQCATWRASKIEPGGIAEYFRVPRGNQRDTLRLPDGVGFPDAALIEPLACVLKSLRRSGVRPGESLYVIGLGVMGLLHVLAARAAGVEVFASDFIEERRSLARRHGATAFDPSQAATVLGEGAHAVICGPGTAAALQAAMSAAAPGGTVVAFTPFDPQMPLTIDPQRLYFSDLRIVASYSCGPDDTRAALRTIADGIVDAEKVGATLVPLELAASAYDDLAHQRIVKPIVVFDQP